MAELESTVVFGDLKITGDLIARNFVADLLDGLNSTSFLRSDITTTLNGGTLYINNPAGTNWCENLRLVAATNGWTSIHMGGAAGGVGTTAGQWSIHTYNNQFRICNGGSDPVNGLNLTDTAITWKNNTVWHAGNDGPGSTLDADTVDGIQASQIPFGASGYGTTNVGSVNNLQKSGFYDCSSGAGNPVADWCHVINNNHYNSATGNIYTMQLSAPFWTQELYFRTTHPSNQTPAWRRMLHDGNLAVSSTAPSAPAAGSLWIW